ncbi:MAG: RNA polymerase sigma factor [Bacteroidetes bacterium]|nr:RNA polymerase sigma factor [Bacteroidota bacterium]
MAAVQIDIHRELIEQCRRGNREAYYKLYKLYAKSMFNICRRMLNNRSEAEDMLQEVFTDVFQRLESFRFDSTFGSWLKQIVVNKCINELKKKKAELEYLDDIEVVDIPEENDKRPSEYELSMSVQKVKKAMEQLPAGNRVIFSLYLLEGYDHVEIAQILNITESTSKSQYMRARLKVKEILTTMSYER